VKRATGRAGRHHPVVNSLPWIAGAAFVAASVAWLGSSKRVAKQAYGTYSVHNTGDDGLSLAYAYLGRIAGRGEAPASVRALTRPIGQAGIEPRAVVFRIAPSDDTWLEMLKRFSRTRRTSGGTPPGKKGTGPPPEEPADTDGKRAKEEGGEEKKNEPGIDTSPAKSILSGEDFAWVNGGGTLVLAISSNLAGLEVRPLAKEARIEKVYPIWPGVSNVSPVNPCGLYGGPTDRLHAVFASGSETLVGRWLLGAGRIVILSCPDVFKNARLGEADHLPLLCALAGTGRPVYFDESVHGIQTTGGMLELLRAWRLGPLVAFAALGALVLYWRRAVRVGPPEDDDAQTRVEAVEFVDSLAELYRRALSNREAIALYFGAFEHEVSIRTGLRGEALAAKVKALANGRAYPRAEGRRDISRSTFRHLLGNLNAAFGRLSDVKRN
jgi:hypothetical protein